MKHLKYKGYLGTVEPDFENNILHGKLAFIRDLVTFEAETLADLEREFKTSVDLYLQSCVEDGKEPDAPFKGVFNVRLDPELGTGKRSHYSSRRGLIAPFCCSLALVFSGITM